MAIVALGSAGFFAGVVFGRWWAVIVAVPAGVVTLNAPRVEGFGNLSSFLVGALIAGMIAAVGVGIGRGLRFVLRPPGDHR